MKYQASLLTVLLAGAFLPLPALAELGGVGSARVTPNPLSVLLGLALVVGMIFAMAWLMRRFGQGAWIPGRNLRPVASMSLGGRERVTLIQVGDEQLLLGVAPGRVSLLARYESPVIPPQQPMPGGSFAQRLREQLAGRGESS